jgi:YVTN family beta-propeller protein
MNTGRFRAIAAMAAVAALLVACSGRSDPVSGKVVAGPSQSPVTSTVAPAPSPTPEGPTSAERHFEKVIRITGALTPKSVDASSTGFVVAQNMIYTHTISVYNPDHELVTTIKDRITPSEFGYKQWTKSIQGGPVEASFSPDGAHLWVSNYSMYGPGFSEEGHDTCSPTSGYDRSFLYRVDTRTWTVDGAVLVGSVPKYVQASPDGKTVLVTNWCTYDLSVIDTATMKQIARIPVGRYPRGIAITADSKRAFVAIMGSTQVKVVDLADLVAGAKGSQVVHAFATPGRAPRHLNLSPDGKLLYVTLNGEGTVAKVDTTTGKVLDRVRTGQAPRSSVLSPDGTALFVVNYESGTVSRVRTSDLKVLESRPVDHHPIGITYNPATREVWVCSYIGVINVFADAE